ncbi:excisionase [Streptomyces violaceoruber]|uniref:excisionase n=1 Tax=unclassified Streptomyces TaxID=2593676 RepID=UPI000D0C7B41|nr:excisionase [Streptomyces sp. 111WW2]PSK57029.1 hypothetical protein B0E38_02560 [Streptomyces sp. 111WW2]
MAATLISPYAATDDVTLKEASALLAETGYPASVETLRRWCRKYNVPLVKHGRAHYASWTQIIKAHRDEIDRADGL